jgi:hypothetical protein
MARTSPTDVERVVIALDAPTMRKLAALERACAEQTEAHGESPASRREITTTALVRGVEELYDVHVRGTAFDLRQCRTSDHQQTHRRGLRVV